MTTLPRDLLARLFDGDPRAISAFEELDRFLSDAEDRITTLLASAQDVSTRLGALEGSASQPLDDLLSAIAALPDESGAIEIVDAGQASVRGIDSSDDACLVSRAQLISYAGKGATASRPVLSAHRRAIYFDTTLNANGKPVFWTGTAWVDSSGAAV